MLVQASSLLEGKSDPTRRRDGAQAACRAHLAGQSKAASAQDTRSSCWGTASSCGSPAPWPPPQPPLPVPQPSPGACLPALGPPGADPALRGGAALQQLQPSGEPATQQHLQDIKRQLSRVDAAASLDKHLKLLRGSGESWLDYAMALRIYVGRLAKLGSEAEPAGSLI